MPLNLAEVPTEDLVLEACSRFDALVFLAVEGEGWTVVVNGCQFTCEGMLHRALQNMKLDMLQSGLE